jgi:hypothetical protein
MWAVTAQQTKCPFSRPYVVSLSSPYVSNLAVSKLSRFTAPLISQQFVTVPLGHNKYRANPIIKYLGPKNLITVCRNKLTGV